MGGSLGTPAGSHLMPAASQGFFEKLCGLPADCKLVMQAWHGDGEVMLNAPSRASASIKRACRPPRVPGATQSTPPKMLYTLLANPFSGERPGPYGHDSSPRGHIPESRMLSLHIDALATLPSRLAGLAIVVPYDAARPPIAGYLGIAASAARLPFAARLILLANNTLGSYGMYMHAFARVRGAPHGGRGG